MNKGYIKLWRKILDTSFYQNPNMIRMAIHLLLTVNHRDKKFFFNGSEITVLAGQSLTGIDKLALELRLTVQMVRTTLKNLEKVRFLTRETTNRFSIVTICRYWDYQKNETTDNKPTNKPVTNQQQASNKLVTANKNEKNEKNEKNKILFELLWKEYPSKIGKSDALDAFLSKGGDSKQIMEALANYKQHLKVETWKKPQNGATWFRNWKDWVDYKDPKPKKPGEHRLDG